MFSRRLGLMKWLARENKFIVHDALYAEGQRRVAAPEKL
jgi:hypothetical protein